MRAGLLDTRPLSPASCRVVSSAGALSEENSVSQQSMPERNV